MKFLIIALALFAGFIASAQAQGTSIEIDSPWARATPAGTMIGGVFLTVINKGTTDDRLLSFVTPAADMADLHLTENDNGVMKMLPVDAIEVKAGQKVALAPGGYHIMLMGLKAPLKEGQSFPLTLTFEKAGKIDIIVKILKAGAMGSGDMGGMNTN